MASNALFSLVSSATPTGNHRRIQLANLDLWIIPRIDNVFVYPAALDMERFKGAVSHAISACPLVAGRFLKHDNDQYFIELSDNGIPVTYVEDQELKEWPLDANVVVELAENKLAPFIDAVQTINLLRNPSEEPLVRLKITRIVQSNEWVLGTSWAHILGDVESNLVFLRMISRSYQQLEPAYPLPIMERRLWREDEADQTLLPLLQELNYAKPLQEAVAAFLTIDPTDEQVNLHFSSQQLNRLRELVGQASATRQDALTSYLIFLLNTTCFKHDDEQRVWETYTVINYRGVSNSIAPVGLMSNAVLVVASEKFENPQSLTGIAQTIRRSITRTRDPIFLERCVATVDNQMKKMAHDGFVPYLGPFSHGITVNSNYRFDWAALVDFGFKDQCRFHTLWTGRFYCRVYRLNPKKSGGTWLPRDYDGAEVALRIPRKIKDVFMTALRQHMNENFSNLEL